MTSQEETASLWPWSDYYRSANEGQDIIRSDSFGIILFKNPYINNSLFFFLIIVSDVALNYKDQYYSNDNSHISMLKDLPSSLFILHWNRTFSEELGYE